VDYTNIAEIWENMRKSGEKMRKSGKKFKYKNCGNLGKKSISKVRKYGKKCGNMATYDFSYAELWQLIDFSQFAEKWENVAELWCFPDFSRFLQTKK
jgi:hypothetical protein